MREIIHHPSISSLNARIPTANKVTDLKLVLLGESAVGKSSLVQRFATDSFDPSKESTIGAAFVTKKIYVSEASAVKLINLQIWDTAGQERYKSLTPMYYRNSNVAIVVFDMTDQQSFEKAAHWISELKLYIRDHSHELQIVLVGNKKDLVTQCDFRDKLNEFTSAQQYPYFEVSAKTGDGIESIFQRIVDGINESQFADVQPEEDQPQKGIVNLSLGRKELAENCNC